MGVRRPQRQRGRGMGDSGGKKQGQGSSNLSVSHGEYSASRLEAIQLLGGGRCRGKTAGAKRRWGAG